MVADRIAVLKATASLYPLVSVPSLTATNRSVQCLIYLNVLWQLVPWMNIYEDP